MYLAQLRYRIMLEVHDDPDARILLAALHEQVGRPINEYIGGDVDEWLAAIDWALDWDAEHGDPITPRAGNEEAAERIRAGLVALRADIEARRDEIPRMRAERGLPNR